MERRKEKVIAKCTRSIKTFPFWLAWITLMVLALVVGLFSNDPIKDKLIGVLGMTLLAIIGVVAILIPLKTQYLMLTDRRLIGHGGFIRSKRMSTPLSKIADISVSNGFWGKLLGYHTITVTTTGNSYYIYRGMTGAVDFTDTVQDYLDQLAPFTRT